MRRRLLEVMSVGAVTLGLVTYLQHSVQGQTPAANAKAAAAAGSRTMPKTAWGHPDLQGLRRFTLATGDAHGLYEKFGFTPPARPTTLMERYFPNIYSN